jgi:hypothetical protein
MTPFHRAGDLVPMFPDGRMIREGEIDEWVEAVSADPATTYGARKVAEGIAFMIRRRAN